MSLSLSFMPSPVLALAGGVALDLDNTVVFQLGIFLVLMLVLEPLLFNPVLRIFALREERTEGERARARGLEEEAGELLERYQREVARVNQVASEQRDLARAETAKLEAEILEEARRSVGRIVEEGRTRINEEVQKMRFDLGRESERLAQDVASNVLGRGLN
jgi:F-type H+-transporting ATPase subunit b